MRICDVVTNSIWFDPRVRRQISEYVKCGAELICVGVKDDKYQAEEVGKLPCGVELIDIPAKYYRENRTVLTKIVRTLYLIRELKREISRSGADIIHANDLDALVPAYFASAKMKCRLIYDTHEIFLENNNIIKNKMLRLFWAFFEKRIIRKVDRVVCVSHAAADYLREKYRIAEPLVVTNCMEPQEEAPAKCGKADCFEVLNHGRFYAGRGYDLMMDAAELLRENREIRFVLRGFGPMEEALRQKARDADLPNVRFDPPVHVEELIPMAKRSCVGLAITVPYCLNFKLSVSNKLFEYAAAGLPVIMSDIPEHRYLNERYGFGLILPENTPEKIAAAVCLLQQDKELYRSLSEGAKKLSAELNWHDEFGKLLTEERRMLGLCAL